MVKKVFLSGLFAVLLFVFATSAFAAQTKGLFVVKDGQWHRQDGGKLSEAPSPNGGEMTDAGWFHWLFADPEMSDEAKGAQRGLYFFSAKEGEYTFLPFKGEGINMISFSSDGKMFIVESSAEENEMYNVALELFTFEDLKSHFKTEKATGSPYWIDIRRFVYAKSDADMPRDMPDDYPSEGTGVAMYDAVAWEETVLKAPTATSDFSVGVMDDDSGDMIILSDEGGSELMVTESYVDSPKDWTDPDTIKSRGVSVPLPAAG